MLDNILVLLDGTEDPAVGIERGASLAREGGGTLHLLVVPRPDPEGAPEEGSGRRASRVVGSAIAEVDTGGIDVNALVLTRQPAAPAVHAYAVANDVDVVVTRPGDDSRQIRALHGDADLAVMAV